MGSGHMWLPLGVPCAQCCVLLFSINIVFLYSNNGLVFMHFCPKLAFALMCLVCLNWVFLCKSYDVFAETVLP